MAKAARKPMTVTITVKDNATFDRIDTNITFDRAVTADTESTPALEVALEFLTLLKSKKAGA